MDVPAEQAQAAKDATQGAPRAGKIVRTALLWMSGAGLVLAAAQPIAAGERALLDWWNARPEMDIASRCNLPSWHPPVDCKSESDASPRSSSPGHWLPPGHPPVDGMLVLPPGHPPIDSDDGLGSYQDLGEAEPEGPTDDELDTDSDSDPPRANAPWWI